MRKVHVPVLEDDPGLSDSLAFVMNHVIVEKAQSLRHFPYPNIAKGISSNHMCIKHGCLGLRHRESPPLKSTEELRDAVFFL